MTENLLDDLDLDALIASIPTAPITAPLVSKYKKLVEYAGDVDLDWYTAREVEFLGGLGVFTWLRERPVSVPIEVWQLFCQCKTSRLGWGYNELHNWWYCTTCELPRPHYGILFECDNCETWFRSPRLPERSFICPDCIEANQ